MKVFMYLFNVYINIKCLIDLWYREGLYIVVQSS